MASRITDSALYAHLWGTDQLRALFDETARLGTWLEILAALARAQAELSILPATAAEAIAAVRVERLDIDAVAEETRRTGHSTLGLIKGLQAILPQEAREWVYYGATVQDLTDTWTGLTMKRVGAIAARDLTAIEGTLLELAERHRDTLMAGRTHGQPGSPITFGYKAAGWADEIGRHLDRLDESRHRCETGQLGGGAGSMAFFGDRALDLRRRFCSLLGLNDPAISWTASRDRVAEFGNTMALIASTCGRIGNEVYELQRPEIGELREPAAEGSIGSITMPHKRNPEMSEHLVTLARLVRSNATILLEGTVTEHERDGRAWKAEFVAFPEVCLLTGTALQLARRILDGLEVDEEAMRRNLGEWVVSEKVLSTLAPTMGKHRAQALLQEALAEGREHGWTMEQSLEKAGLPAGAAALDPGAAPRMADEVIARARTRRSKNA